MATTTSLGFPNMFSIAKNQVNVLQGNTSVVNRTRLLLLTEPTELYNNPTFGVGLRKHLWQYNNENRKAIVQKNIVEQLRLHEPCSVPDETKFVDDLVFTGSAQPVDRLDKLNALEMTVAVMTKFGDTVEVTTNEK